MTALPVRFANRATCCFDCCKKNEALLAQALAIAWEALEYAAEDRTEHLQNLTWVGQTAEKAMRRIEKLGARG